MVPYTRDIYTNIHRRVPQKFIEDAVAYIKAAKPKLYGKITIKKAAYMLLDYMVTYDGFQKLEKRWNFPHSNMKQVFGTIRRIMARFASSKIKPGTLSLRRRIAREYVKNTRF